MLIPIVRVLKSLTVGISYIVMKSSNVAWYFHNSYPTAKAATVATS